VIQEWPKNARRDIRLALTRSGVTFLGIAIAGLGGYIAHGFTYIGLAVMFIGFVVQVLALKSLSLKVKGERRRMEAANEACRNRKSWQLWIFLAAELIWNGYFIFGVLYELTLGGVPHGTKVNELWILFWVWLIGNLVLACAGYLSLWAVLEISIRQKARSSSH
jgi:MFS family permease